MSKYLFYDFENSGHACKTLVDGNETYVKGLGLKAYWLEKNSQ